MRAFTARGSSFSFFIRGKRVSFHARLQVGVPVPVLKAAGMVLVPQRAGRLEVAEGGRGRAVAGGVGGVEVGAQVW